MNTIEKNAVAGVIIDLPPFFVPLFKLVFGANQYAQSRLLLAWGQLLVQENHLR